MKRLKNWVLSIAVATTLLPSSIAGATTIEDIESPQIKAGRDHSIARKWDGTVWAWGSNVNGQLGIGTTTSSSIPVKVNSLSNIVNVAAGSEHSMALKDDGTVVAWGQNQFGQLGDGTTTNQTEPVKVKNLKDVVAIEGGFSHSVAVNKDGDVYTWGKNDYWQLGANEADYVSSPFLVPGVDKVKEAGAGLNYTVALKKDGTVWTWGYNGDGQLGDGTYNSYKGVPVQVAGLKDVKTIATGDRHILALTNDGTIWAWGRNTDGQLGNGSANSSNKPIKVPGMTDVVAIGAGTDFSLAVKKDGTVWGWGSNYRYQLGDSNINAKKSPALINCLDATQGSNIEVVSITGGEFHTLVIKKDGSAWSIGKNEYGQLGDGSTKDSYDSVKVQRVFGNDAHLKSLRLSDGVLKPNFNRLKTEYTANVGNSVENIKFGLTPYNPKAVYEIKVNNISLEGDAIGSWSDPYVLVFGSNDVVITILTPDAYKQYHITINREDNIPVTGITIDQTKLEMQVGSTPVMLKATITPENATNNNMTWSSSNPQAVQVDQNGLVTPLSAGESTIRVTTVDGGKMAECKVIVKQQDTEPSIVELETSKEVFLLKPKKSSSVKVYAIYSNGEKKEITRDQNTKYTSSSTTIAKATKGLIRVGNKEGIADITVSYQNQSTTIKVIVSKDSVTKLKSSETKVTIQKGESKEITLTAILSNKSEIDVTSLATWTTSNKKVVSVEDGKLTAVSKGKATVKATFEGKTSTITVTVK